MGNCACYPWPQARSLKAKRASGTITEQLLVAQAEDNTALQKSTLATEAAVSPAAEDLARKGCSVRQLLQFYIAHEERGLLNGSSTTREVTRRIVVPEIAKDKLCYMESSFMREQGGPMKATKLISHALDSCFVVTVLNIVQDATGWSSEELLQRSGFLLAHGEWYGRPNVSKLLSELEKKSSSALQSVYWLNIFAVSEHGAIPSECWTGDIMRAMEGGVVVSLDSELSALARIWVVREVGQALQGVDVRFRMALGMSAAAKQAFTSGKAFTPVRRCMASSAADKQRLLAEINRMEGGQAAFDDFISCLISLSLGYIARLETASKASKALAQVERLEMDYRWCGDTIRNLDRLVSAKKNSFRSMKKQVMDSAGAMTGQELKMLSGLRVLSLNFGGCQKLTHVKCLREQIGSLQTLQQLTVNFDGCMALEEVTALGQGIGRLHMLEQLTLNLSGCVALAEVTKFTQSLVHLERLEQLALLFDGCTQLTDADVTILGKSIGQMQGLQHLSLDFANCEDLTEVAALGDGIGCLLQLQRLDINFSDCEQLTQVEELGLGIGKLQNLTRLKLDFHYCMELTEIAALGDGVAELKELEQLTLIFDGCKELADVGALGEGIGELAALQQLTLGFYECEQLTGVAELGEGIGKLQDLGNLTLDFSHCKAMTQVESLSDHIVQLPKLHALQIWSRRCSREELLQEVAENARARGIIVFGGA